MGSSAISPLLTELAEVFPKDLEKSVRLQAKSYRGRGFFIRLAENACLLLSLGLWWGAAEEC